jgi:hypothetical protein
MSASKKNPTKEKKNKLSVFLFLKQNATDGLLHR